MNEIWDPTDWTTAPEFSSEARVVERAGIDALCQKIDRILTGSLSVEVGEYASLFKGNTQGPSASSPGCSSGRTVYLNHSLIESMSDNNLEKRLRISLGVNLHELGHLDFTPALNNDIWKQQRSRLQWYEVAKTDSYLNLLEDQRQELLAGQKYPRSRDYFRLVLIAMLRKAAFGNNGHTAQTWPLIYGRRHLLPAEFMNSMDSLAIERYGTETVGRVKAIITEYQHLSSRGDDNLRRMYELAVELWRLIDKEEFNGLPQPCHRSPKLKPRVGEKEEAGLSKEANKALEELDKKREQGKSEPGSKSEPGKGEQTQPERDKTLDSVLEKFEEQVVAKLQDDLNSKMDSLIDNMGSGYDEGDEGAGNGAQWTPAQSEFDDSRRIAAFFRDIAQDLKQQDFRNLKRGRLDTRRLSSALASNSNRLFRRRQPDMSRNASMAVHVAFDGSGSMGGFRDNIGQWTSHYNDPDKKYIITKSRGWHARRAAYVIAKASELGGHFSKVTAFGLRTRSIKGWTDKKFHSENTGGMGSGTDPLDGFRRSIRDFDAVCQENQINNKVYMILTDGAFSGDNNKVLRILKMQGVHVYVIGIGFRPRGMEEFNVVEVPDAKDLEEKMRELLKDLSIKITQRVRRDMM